MLGIERGCTGHDILRASNIRGSRSSTSGSPATPNTRARFVALMFANIDTQDFHAGPGVEVGSHLTRGLYLAIATLILLSPPKVVMYRKLRKNTFKTQVRTPSGLQAVLVDVGSQSSSPA